MKARSALLISAVAFLLAHCARFAETWTDDAFITFRYARRFAAGEGMTFNPGEHVEGLTNLGWAILLAPFSDGDLLRTAQVLGVAASVVTLLVLERWCTREKNGLLGTTAALAVVVGMPWVPYWAMQGLETPLVLLLTTVAWTRYPREIEGGPPIAAIALALAPWVRPDAALTCLVIGAWHLRRPGPRWQRPALVALAIGVVSGVTLVGVKLAWFGAVLPNTFSVKVDHFPPDRGVWYLWHFLTLPNPVIPVLVGAGVAWGLRLARSRDDRGLPAALVVAHLVAVTLQNGDIFADYRLWVPIWPAAAACLALGVDAALGSLNRARIPAAVLFSALLGGGLFSGWRFGAVDHLDSDDPWRVVVLDAPPWAPWKAWNDGGRPRDQMPFAAVWSLVHAGPEDTVAYSELGLIGWLVDGPVLDMLGLTNPLMAEGGETAWARQRAHVEERAGAMMIMVQAGLWTRWRDRLAEGAWSLDAACGGTWIFRNTAVELHPPDSAELERRFGVVLRRAPRMTAVLTGLAAELVAAGRVEEAARWLDRVEAAGALDDATLARARCGAGIGDGCQVQSWCQDFDQRLTAAQIGDPTRWPKPREALLTPTVPAVAPPAKPVTPAASATPEVTPECQALRAEVGAGWENLARDVPHLDVWGRVPRLARDAARTARAGDPELTDLAKRTVGAVEQVPGGDPRILAAARALEARSAPVLGCR